MNWLRTLTPKQRRVLIALAVSVLVVTGLLAWSVWSTLQQARVPTPSPLPTPVSPPATPTRRPTATPSPAPTRTPAPDATFDISRAGIVASEVAEARQTSGRWGTPLTLVDDTDMARALYAHYQTSPPLVLRARPVLTQLHLWFWDTLRQDVVSQASDAAAFYSPEREELYLRRDWTGTRETLETQLAYGYARALPEQVGNLRTLREEALVGPTATLDRGLALSAIADGDAFIALLLYEGIEPGSARADRTRAEIAQAVCPGWRVTDPLLEDLSCLAFNLGTDFATTLFAEGGTAALDAAILRPPRSTEQLLHPEVYMMDTGMSTQTASSEPRLLTPLEPELGRGWIVTTTETVGEALMGAVMREWSNEELGAEEVRDWEGDLFQVWETEEGASVSAWQIAWSGWRRADEFYRHLLDLLPRVLVPGRITDTTAPSDLRRGKWWSGSQGAAYLYRFRDRVWLVWGTDAGAVEAVAGAIE